jgi:type IV fimbrial biogenesis protein FimT
MKRSEGGFSMIEVMIVVLVASILIMAAIPSFTVWIQNTQIRTASDSLLNALQTARNEAIRRNACVQVEMKDQPKTSWEVQRCDFTAGDPVIASRPHQEGTENVTIATVASDTTVAKITSFNALGRVVTPNPSNGSTAMAQIDIRNTTLQVGDERRLRIEIPVGGAIKLCDPKNTVAATDPRRCQVPLP